ncbi:hypothetical protein, partial [Candidatus Venteria ishoeyi]|uniref:hypothetical protein n=1 Tax=Candidatus Venteria ishoeyi TaxID=1899563 RepID=UPI0011AFE943
MADAIILANGKAYKTSYFDSTLFSFHKNGFVNGFQKNGIYYRALYFGGKLDNYSCYCKANEFYKIKSEYDYKGIKRPIGILDPHKFDGSNLNNNLATTGDTIKVQLREIIQTEIRTTVKSWPYTGDVYDISDIITHPNEQIVGSPTSTYLTTESIQLYNSYLSRPANLETWESEVVKDICELLSTMTPDIKAALNGLGKITVFNKEVDSWDHTSAEAAQHYALYTNDQLVRYREFLKSYKVWFLSAKESLLTMEDSQKLFSVVGYFSSKALEYLDVPDKIRILDVFTKEKIHGYYLSNGEFNEEHIVLKVFKSVTLTQSSEFLDELAKPHRYCSADNNNTTLLEAMYNCINDKVFGLDDDNRHSLMLHLYLIWYVSSFNPYNEYDFSSDTTDTDDLYNSYINDTSSDLIMEPLLLDYNSEKSWGYYVDNMNFKFENGKILIEKKEWSTSSSNPMYSPGGITTSRYKPIGKYNYYQSIGFKDYKENDLAVKFPLIEIPTSSSYNTFGIPNQTALAPLFVLKYIDDYGDTKDFYTGLRQTLDVAL